MLWPIVMVLLWTGGPVNCLGLSPPMPGPTAEPYAPAGTYAGHWGMDYAASLGTAVRSAAAGRVTFSGVVVGNSTVTVDHGGGLRTSYSYLSDRFVGAGARVSRGAVLGATGKAHGVPALHLSVRVGARYVDPARLLGCRETFPPESLRLLPGYR